EVRGGRRARRDRGHLPPQSAGGRAARPPPPRQEAAAHRPLPRQVQDPARLLRAPAGGPRGRLQRRMRLLLDTCTFLWLALGERSLSRAAREAFTDPANDVYLSAISSWEIALKHALGKLALPEQPTVLVPAMRARLRVETLALDERAALAIAQLPDL